MQYFLIALLISTAVCWEAPVPLLSPMSAPAEIFSALFDPATLTTHLTLRFQPSSSNASAAIYLRVDQHGAILANHSLEPGFALYRTKVACLATSGASVTVVSELESTVTSRSSIWYTSSQDLGKTWTDYQQIPAVSSVYNFSRHLACPLVNVKESNRIIAVYSTHNVSTGSKRPLILTMATKPGDSSVFGAERNIGVWPSRKESAFATAAYTSQAGKTASIHVFSRSAGSSSWMHTRSLNMGLTWGPLLDIAYGEEEGYGDILNPRVASVPSLGEIYFPFELNRGELAMIISRTHGKSWWYKYTLGTNVPERPYSLEVCRRGVNNTLVNYIPLEKGGYSLNVWDTGMKAKKEFEHPYAAKEYQNAHLVCGTEKAQDWMVVLASKRGEDKRYQLYVSHNSSAAAGFPWSDSE